MTDEAMSPLRRRMIERHDDPEVRAEDPAELHPNHQEAGCVSRSRAAEQRDEIAPPRVGHGASSSGVTTGNKAVSSACHNAAGKSSGQT